MIRRTALFAAAFLAAGAISSPALLTPAAAASPNRAHGDLEAEQFVQSEAGRVLQVLSDREISDSAKKQTFRQVVNEVADVPRITSFVLGRYRRLITPVQFQAFSEAFREYANSIYESRLGQYRGQRFKVLGSIVRQPGDVVVESEVEQPNGAGTPVNWRVLRAGDGRYRVVDVQVAGVWLAITEQQDFVSTLDNHNGDFNVLITQLRREAAGQP